MYMVSLITLWFSVWTHFASVCTPTGSFQWRSMIGGSHSGWLTWAKDQTAGCVLVFVSGCRIPCILFFCGWPSFWPTSASSPGLAAALEQGWAGPGTAGDRSWTSLCLAKTPLEMANMEGDEHSQEDAIRNGWQQASVNDARQPLPSRLKSQSGLKKKRKSEWLVYPLFIWAHCSPLLGDLPDDVYGLYI